MANRNLKQVITYWAVTGTDTYGKTTFAAPVTMAARWESKVQLIQNKYGKEIVSKARVYASEVLEVDGYVYLGESVSTTPMTLEGAQEIQLVGQSPDLRNLTQLTVAYV